MSTRVLVYGLWHLGSVTAACLAEHFNTVGYDPDDETVSKLRSGQPPVFEPGLAELVQVGLSSGGLSFTDDLATAARAADVIWVTFDTPVGDDDSADVDFVTRQVRALFPLLTDGTLVLISSQVPTGYTAETDEAFRQAYPGRDVTFAYSPENLRLGSALDAFRRPQRIVVGARVQADRSRLTSLLAPFCRRLDWVSVESAEMTKHALNAYLATSIAFINELAVICERVGADAREVEHGLRSDPRIGPKAYVTPGSAFAGGTLDRDIKLLTEIGGRAKLPTHLLSAVRSSNEEHKDWPRRKLQELLGELDGRTVAILGLTYKPDTDTLRRSSAVELCLWLTMRGVKVRAFDPAITQPPSELAELRDSFRLCATDRDALRQADALLLATAWPCFRELSADDIVAEMREAVVVDPDRFLADALEGDARVRYVAVGQPMETA